jgi:hypothetical protein
MTKQELQHKIELLELKLKAKEDELSLVKMNAIKYPEDIQRICRLFHAEPEYPYKPIYKPNGTDKVER